MSCDYEARIKANTTDLAALNGQPLKTLLAENTGGEIN
ncbi:Uncharacterised protein [Kingella potus]|uniref:Uncharacterized protein n=1 Tax=Kingella potus TaxID=265175 RepID=A0A377R0E6_9NEIS|nr:Uncharacterised protein [Kingella potus]